MCGIAGVFCHSGNAAIDRDGLERMVDSLYHRGPDANGIYEDNYVGFAHTRLSIIDLSSGAQPMHSGDKSIWIVFNGEIYNYLELREELVSSGYTFRTHSDTEVIIKLYEKYGLDFVNYLNGQFAIAIWDKPRKRLLLTRDRVGITPLFYKEENKSLIFASEIKAIKAYSKNNLKANITGLNQIYYGWTTLGNNTVFEDVKLVKPGELIVFEDNQKKEIQYWDWNFVEKGQYSTDSEEQSADKIRDLLVQATRIRLRSDVPVGAYLSGGLDSSSLVSLIHNFSDTPLRTFSIGFDDKNVDESSFQSHFVDYLGADHSSINCSASDIADNFVDTIWHTESPILRTAPTPMKLLSSLVRKNDYKVVLTGEGADEVFGGYDLFKEFKIRKFWGKNKDSVWRPLLLRRLYPYLDFTKKSSISYLKAFFGMDIDKLNEPYFGHITRWDTTSKCMGFLNDELRQVSMEDYTEKLLESIPEEIESWDSFNQMQYIEARGLMSGYLLSSQGDRMLMSNSVEGRFPFLDHNVIEYVNTLSPNLKMKVLDEKYILKRAMNKLVPEQILMRKKQPYRAPDIPAFMNKAGEELIASYMSEEAIKYAGFFDHKKTNILVKKARAGKAIGFKDNMAFVSVLSTQIWHDKFIN